MNEISLQYEQRRRRRRRQRSTSKFQKWSSKIVSLCVCVCACVFLFVRQSERLIEREREKKKSKPTKMISNWFFFFILFHRNYLTVFFWMFFCFHLINNKTIVLFDIWSVKHYSHRTNGSGIKFSSQQKKRSEFFFLNSI